MIEMAQGGQGGLGDDETDAAGDGDDAGPGSDVAQQESPPPIKRVLPAEPVGDPASWQRSPVVCENQEAAIGSAYIGFAVPEDWRLGGRSGGSGSPTNMNFDYTFQPEELGEVNVSIESEIRDIDGKLRRNGEVIENPSFDYDHTLGDDTVRIVYESIGGVPTGNSTAGVFVARAEQAPEHLSRTTYAASVNLADVPQRGPDGWQLVPQTFVIEISYRPEKGDIGDATARSIISSLTMPDCSIVNLITMLEITNSIDFDGDGHVSDRQDYMDALQAGR